MSLTLGNATVTQGTPGITFLQSVAVPADASITFGSQPGVVYRLQTAISASTPAPVPAQLKTSYTGITAASTPATWVPSARIVILDAPADPLGNFHLVGVFWLDASPNRTVPGPSTSAVPGISAADLALIQGGSVLEVPFDTRTFRDKTGAKVGPFHDNSYQAALSSILADKQAAVTNPAVPGLIGIALPSDASGIWTPLSSLSSTATASVGAVSSLSVVKS